MDSSTATSNPQNLLRRAENSGFYLIDWENNGANPACRPAELAGLRDEQITPLLKSWQAYEPIRVERCMVYSLSLAFISIEARISQDEVDEEERRWPGSIGLHIGSIPEIHRQLVSRGIDGRPDHRPRLAELAAQLRK